MKPRVFVTRMISEAGLSLLRAEAEGDRYVRAGRWDRFQMTLLLGADVHGKTLGVAGFSRIPGSP